MKSQQIRRTAKSLLQVEGHGLAGIRLSHRQQTVKRQLAVRPPYGKVLPSFSLDTAKRVALVVIIMKNVVRNFNIRAATLRKTCRKIEIDEPLISCESRLRGQARRREIRKALADRRHARIKPTADTWPQLFQTRPECKPGHKAHPRQTANSPFLISEV